MLVDIVCLGITTFGMGIIALTFVEAAFGMRSIAGNNISIAFGKTRFGRNNVARAGCSCPGTT